MRIAVTGKGGSGKSTIAGALARHLGRQGHQVVAVDADPNPNLGVALGVPWETVESITPILNALLASGHTHNDPTPAADELLARYGVAAPDGVTLIATGKIERPSDACLCCGSHNTTRQFFGGLPADARVVVADLEAGLSDLIWAHPGPQDIVLAVSEGSTKSREIARRACRLAEEMGVRRIVGVANRSTAVTDAARLAEELAVDEVASIPDDAAIEMADHLGRAAIDASPASPAIAAIEELADRLVGTAG
jgi:CO dehydrogenase maturation factor